MNEAQSLLDFLGKAGVPGLLALLGWAFWRGHVRWGRDFLELKAQYDSHIADLKTARELEISNLKLSHAETIAGLKDRMASDTTSSRENTLKLEKRCERWEALATDAHSLTKVAMGAATTKPPGAET